MIRSQFNRCQGFVTMMLLVIVSACGNSGSELTKLIDERDSLRDCSRQQKARLDKLDGLIQTINYSLDTIAAEEAGIFINGVSEGPDTKRQIMGNIDRLSSLISRQRAEIEKFESKLSNQSEEGSDPNMNALIANFKRQLQEKDNQIAALKEELSRKDADIMRLNQRVGLQSQTIAELDRRNTAQNEALKRQDAMLNQCYMTIGTKKELEKKGIVKKGKIVAQSSLDRSKFSKVDIRKLTEVQFTAKHPRIITAMPQSAYELTTDGNHNYTLRITNPTEFWRISNYLVIQTN